MRVSETMFSSNLMAQMNQLQSQQLQLQNQVTTGLKVTLPEDDPSAMEQVLNLQTQASANSQYQSNISQLQNTATTASTAMNSLQTLIEQANEIATSADGTSSSQQLSTDATQVEGLIQQALQLANTQDAQGNYIFGGTATSSAPFVAATDSTGAVTSVSYQGNTGVAQAAISPTLNVALQTPGANATGSGPAGLFADSRTGADLFSHLIALKNDLTSGNTTAISSTDAPNLTKDQDNIISQIGANGVLQSTLQTAGNSATQQSTNLSTQISNDTSANMPETLTQLDQVQTAFQAALQSGVMIMQLSILDFLS
jgi:flagellar hook-associated protein 3 FlgL